MLNDRIDGRLSGDGLRELNPGLAARWQATAREEAAERFDLVAKQIEDGLVRVRGARKNDVTERLRDRAHGVRAGTQPIKR